MTGRRRRLSLAGRLAVPLFAALVPSAALGQDTTLSGIWNFAGGGATLVLQQKDQAITGQFRSSDGSTTWDVKGSFTNGQVVLVRYIPVSELVANKLPPELAQIALRQFPTDRPGFIHGDVTLTYNPTQDTLEGSYTTYSAIWTPSTNQLDHFYTQDNDLHLLRPHQTVAVPGYTGKP